MCLQASRIRPQDAILATLCSWLTLAGFVVFPSIFSLLQTMHLLDSMSDKTPVHAFLELAACGIIGGAIRFG
jgi:hypothetical protein